MAYDPNLLSNRLRSLAIRLQFDAPTKPCKTCGGSGALTFKTGVGVTCPVCYGSGLLRAKSSDAELCRIASEKLAEHGE